MVKKNKNKVIIVYLYYQFRYTKPMFNFMKNANPLKLIIYSLAGGH